MSTSTLAISVREAAKELGVSPPQVYTHLLHRPDFPAFKIGERWLVSREGLKEWMEDQIAIRTVEGE